MGINRIWRTTSSFRKFRKKTHELSRIYWTQQMATDCLREILLTKPQNEIASQVIPVSFKYTMHPDSVIEVLNSLPAFMEKNRLHLLAIYTAFLETYLKEITHYFTASKGHIENPDSKTEQIKLDPVGSAISAPITKSSTVPDMITYASAYFDIDFGPNAKKWISIYKIRCAAVHLGGIATPKFLANISSEPLALKPAPYESIGLTWDELRNAMRWADDIAATIDAKISDNEVRALEAEDIFRELNSRKKLPPLVKMFQYLHDEYGIERLSDTSKKSMRMKFYGVY